MICPCLWSWVRAFILQRKMQTEIMQLKCLTHSDNPAPFHIFFCSQVFGMNLLCLVVELCTPLLLPAVSCCGQLVFRWVCLGCLPVLSTQPLPAPPPTPSSLFPLPRPAQPPSPASHPRAERPTLKTKGSVMGKPLVRAGQATRTVLGLLLCLLLGDLDTSGRSSVSQSGVDRRQGLGPNPFTLPFPLPLAAAPPAASRLQSAPRRPWAPERTAPPSPPWASSASVTSRRPPSDPSLRKLQHRLRGAWDCSPPRVSDPPFGVGKAPRPRVPQLPGTVRWV